MVVYFLDDVNYVYFCESLDFVSYCCFVSRISVGCLASSPLGSSRCFPFFFYLYVFREVLKKLIQKRS